MLSHMSIDEIEGRLDALVALNEALFDWCTRCARRSLDQGEIESAMRWARLAGNVADEYGRAQLVSPDLEKIFVDVGGALPAVVRGSSEPNAGAWHWIHVMTESHRIGGHSALVRRWVAEDPSPDRHELVVTGQISTVADQKTTRVFVERGGKASFLAHESSLVSRAVALRRAAESSDVVVLHVHPWDPVPAAAFAPPANQPVLVMNHADHVYWSGVSAAGVVLNIRPSGEALCATHRGAARSFRLPIPLPDTQPVDRERGGQIRESLRIPAEAPVFLTIGSSFKYTPTPDLSFTDTAFRILDSARDAHLIAVGPNGSECCWRDLAERVPGRVHAVGVQNDLGAYFAAATVYLEGFPFGSLTAMLEAVLAGLPPVLAPVQCPLPYRSDDFEFFDFAAPRDTEEYSRTAIFLARDAAQRATLSKRLSTRVMKAHCASNWTDNLVALKRTLARDRPRQTGVPTAIESLSADQVRYWARFSIRQRGEPFFGNLYRRAALEGLRPVVDSELLHQLSTARTRGLNMTSPRLTKIGSQMLAIRPFGAALQAYLNLRRRA